MSAPFQVAVLEAARDYLREGADTPVDVFVAHRRRAFARAFLAGPSLQFAFASALTRTIGAAEIAAVKIAELRSRSAGGDDRGTAF